MEAVLQVFLPGNARLFDLSAEGGFGRFGQEGVPVFLPFPVADGDEPVAEVEVFDAQPEDLGDTKSGPVQKHRGESVRAAHVVDDELNFGRGEHDRHALQTFGADECVDGVPLCPENISVEKEKRVERLILCRCGNASGCGEVGQEVADIVRAEVARVGVAVIPDVPDNPSGVGLFRLVGVPFAAAPVTYAVEEAGC